MAPARHETSGAGHPDSSDVEKPGYGTRSSKRKASDISTVPQTSGTKVSSRSSKPKVPKKANVANEPQEPIVKKRRSSPTPATSQTSSSAQSSSDNHLHDQNSVGSNQDRNSVTQSPDQRPVDQASGSSTSPVPERDQDTSIPKTNPKVTVDVPSGSTDDEDGPPKTPNGDVGSPDGQVTPPGTPAGRTTYRGRGRGRGGRGGRGRGGRGSRGGRGGTARGGGTTPARAPARRGRARKKPENPRIDALIRRKAELKAQFKIVSSLQRAALAAVSDKSLEFIKADPLYHESLPEFEQVVQGLRAQYQRTQDELDFKYSREVGLANRKREYEEYIAMQQYELATEEIRVAALARIKEHALYVYDQGVRGGPLDEIPFSKGEDGRVVKQSTVPPKFVHWVANPWLNPQPAATSRVRSTLGDNDYEQHPANWWAAKNPRQKAEILKKQAEIGIEKQREKDKLNAGGKAKKGYRDRNALFQPNAQPQEQELPPVPEEGEDVEDPEPEPVEEETADPAEEQAAAEDEASGPEPDNAADSLEDSDADPQPLDEFGVLIPRKRTRKDQDAPYNRIVVKPPFKFRNYEIGIRRHYTQKLPDNTIRRLGREAHPNPENFYFEQRLGRYNSAKNQPEDLDQDIVAQHKIHPRLGVPVAGSINPSFTECEGTPTFPKPTDWSKPLEPSKPAMFIHTSLDGKRSISRTSRSEWMIRTDKEYDELEAKMKMRHVLDEAGDLERPPTPVIEEPEPEPQQIDDDLLKAVNASFLENIKEQKALRLEEERVAREIQANYSPITSTYSPQTSIYAPQMAAYSPPSAPFSPPKTMFSPPTSMPPPPPQRSHGYDPVRDRTYRTPYSQPVQPVQPVQPPPQLQPFSQGGNLAVLAETAEFHASPAPPSAYGAPRNLYAGPAPMQPAQQQRLGGVASFFPHPHPQAPQYASPRAAAGSRHRELRPAPPQQRAPPPPPSRWFGGYPQ